MHEASITKNIIDTVIDSETIKEIKGRITKVTVIAGVCQGLVPESMQMYFDMEKKDTPLEFAVLEVELQHILAECPDCRKEHILEIPYMYCPDCGSPMKLIKGNELIISSIEVNEE